MMGDAIYIQTEKHVNVHTEVLFLKDLAQVAGGTKVIRAKLQMMPVVHLQRKQYGRYKLDVVDLIQKIQDAEPRMTITHVGEPEIVVQYISPLPENVIWSWMKTVFVCLVAFFGTMFSIMTFHTDVDIQGLFEKIYQSFFAEQTSGFTILEVSYSVGIGLGVILFFNHFGKWKIRQDPTPLEVEMCAYEEQIDNAVLDIETEKGQ